MLLPMMIMMIDCRHQSMLDYLNGMGERFAETAAAFEREAGIAKSTDGTTASVCVSVSRRVSMLVVLVRER